MMSCISVCNFQLNSTRTHTHTSKTHTPSLDSCFYLLRMVFSDKNTHKLKPQKFFESFEHLSMWIKGILFGSFSHSESPNMHATWLGKGTKRWHKNQAFQCYQQCAWMVGWLVECRAITAVKLNEIKIMQRTRRITQTEYSTPNTEKNCTCFSSFPSDFNIYTQEKLLKENVCMRFFSVLLMLMLTNKKRRPLILKGAQQICSKLFFFVCERRASLCLVRSVEVHFQQQRVRREEASGEKKRRV